MAALQHFRSGDPNILVEMLEIQENGSISDTLISSLRKLVTDKKYYTPLFILNTLFLLMAFSGKFTINHYTSILFQHASGNKTEYFSSVVTSLMNLIGSCAYIPLVRRLPRKLLFSVSALVMGLSLTMLGVSMYCHTLPSVAAVWITQSTWIPLLAATLYFLAAPIGFYSIPYIYTAEFFPPEVNIALSCPWSYLSLGAVPSIWPDSGLRQHLCSAHADDLPHSCVYARPPRPGLLLCWSLPDCTVLHPGLCA